MKKKIRIVRYPIEEKCCLRERGKEYKGKGFDVTTNVHRIEHQDEAGEWQVLIEKIEPLLKDLGIFHGGCWQYSYEPDATVPDTFADLEGSTLYVGLCSVDRKHGLADIILRDEKTLDFVLLSIDNSGHEMQKPYRTWEYTGKYVAWRGYSAIPEKKLYTGVNKFYYPTFDFTLRSLDLDKLDVSWVGGVSTFCKYSNCKIHKRDAQIDSLAELSVTKVLYDLDKHFYLPKTREYTVSYDCFEKIKDIISLGE